MITFGGPTQAEQDRGSSREPRAGCALSLFCAIQHNHPSKTGTVELVKKLNHTGARPIGRADVPVRRGLNANPTREDTRPPACDQWGGRTSSKFFASATVPASPERVVDCRAGEKPNALAHEVGGSIKPRAQRSKPGVTITNQYSPRRGRQHKAPSGAKKNGGPLFAKHTPSAHNYFRLVPII